MRKNQEYMKKIVIIGASGHGKVVADIAALNGYNEISFLDDNEAIKLCGEYLVVGKTEKIKEMEGDVIIAIGNAVIRKRIQESIEAERLVTLIHPNAVVAGDVLVGEGTVIMAGAVVNPASIIGRGCIINTASSVDHDCKLGDYVHIAVGAHIAGAVEIGESTWVGAGATISNNVKICDECMIGAGALVVKDIDRVGTYIGIPVRMK